MLVFWFLFLVALPVLLERIARAAGALPYAFPEERPVAVVLFTLCSVLGLTSAMTMALAGHGTPLPVDAPRKLVSRGPYALVRNPMAIAGLGQGIAVALWMGSPWVALYVIAGGLVWNYGVRPLEERHLREQFGGEFDNYARRVRCWWPRLKS
jgi:protein-S-isoprenylcysteine O-methyltransferase Ste14